MTTPEQGPGSADEPSTYPASPTVVTVVVGTAIIAADQLRSRARSAGSRASSTAIGFLTKIRDRSDNTRAGVRAAVTEADRRGRAGLDERRSDATALVDTTVTGTLGWVQGNVMPQLIDGLVPHLISDVLPRLIDGALPEIQARVIPVLIDDLTNDPRIRELILAQSRGVLGQATEQVRIRTARADDRIDTAAHRIFGRTDKANNGGTSGHGNTSS